MTIAVICAALLALLVFGLGFAVSMTRAKTESLAGFKDEPADPLYKIIRAHGNTAEYASVLAVLMLYLGTTSPASWVTWTMIIVTMARYLWAAGVVFPTTMAQPNPMRFIGALVTYLGGFTLVAATLLTVA